MNPKRHPRRNVLRLALAAACLVPLLAWADAVGTVANLSGTLSAKDEAGNLRILSQKSEVAAGEILYTGKGSYARMKFTDGSEVTLRPESQFKVENYHYDQAQPQKDSGVFSLLKGGLRTVTGLIGKRGNQDGYRMNSASATIGIRGTHFGALFCQNDCGGIQTAAGKPPENGLHLDVADGAIMVANAAGTQVLSSGQFGFVRDAATPPVIVPPESGVKVTVPPRMAPSGAAKGSTADDTKDNECP